MMQQLYILRHGQTETNVRGAFTGQLDVPLTEEGLREARDAGVRLAGWGWKPDVVATSPLIRAQRTAELVAVGHTLSVYPGLTEASLGILEGRTFREAHALWPELMDAWVVNRDPVGFRLPGAETNREVFDRTMDALERIRADHPGAERILIVTHSTVVSMLLSGLITGGLDALLNFSARNAKFATVELWPDRARLTGLNL